MTDVTAVNFIAAKHFAPLKNGSRAWFVNALLTAKVHALRKIYALLSYGKSAHTQVSDVDSFYAAMAEYSLNATLSYQFDYARLILDIYTPAWKNESPLLCGLLAPDRSSDTYRSWRSGVYKRDGFRCRACRSKSNLHAHHIVPWSVSVAQRFDIDNGVLLCQPCHVKQHSNMCAQVWQ